MAPRLICGALDRLTIASGSRIACPTSRLTTSAMCGGAEIGSRIGTLETMAYQRAGSATGASTGWSKVNADPSQGCAGKKIYRSFAYAEVIAKRSSQRNDEPMRAYHCRHCHKFHVGTRAMHKSKPRVEESDDE